MKKILSIAIIFVIVALLSTTMVNAATTTDAVSQIYAIGTKYGMTSADKVRLERFMKDNSITGAQADQLIAKAQEANTVMTDAGITNVKDLSVAQKNQLKTIANEAASAVGVTLNFGTSSVEVYKDGKLIETITSSNGKLAYTGNNVNMILVVSSVAVIALIATATVVAKKRLANIGA